MKTQSMDDGLDVDLLQRGLLTGTERETMSLLLLTTVAHLKQLPRTASVEVPKLALEHISDWPK
jgi:hypothetical protein